MSLTKIRPVGGLPNGRNRTAAVGVKELQTESTGVKEPMTRRLFSSLRGSALAGLVLALALTAAACGDDRKPSVETNRNAPTGSPSIGASPESTALSDTSPGTWTSKPVQKQGPDGITRPCVELATRGVMATTCVSLPGVSSWIVGGDHFVLTHGTDIALDDGSVIRADSDGFAIGLLGNRSVADDATSQGVCDRQELAVAIRDRFGPISAAWLPVACVNDQVSLVEFNEPIGNIALLKRKGAWVVLGVVSSQVGCDSLEGEMQDACRALKLDN